MVKLAQKQLYQVFQVCWLHSLQLDRSIFLPSAKFYDSGSPQFKLEMPLQLPMLRLDYDEDNEISNFQSLRVSLRFLKQSYHSDDLSIFFGWLPILKHRLHIQTDCSREKLPRESRLSSMRTPRTEPLSSLFNTTFLFANFSKT